MSSKSEAMETEAKNFSITIGELSSILTEKGKDAAHFTQEESLTSEQVKALHTRVVKKSEELEKLLRVCTHFNEMTQEVEEWCERKAKSVITTTSTATATTTPCLVDEDEVKTQQIELVEVSLFRIVIFHSSFKESMKNLDFFVILLNSTRDCHILVINF